MATDENTTPNAIHRTPYNTTTSLLSHIIPLVLFACQSLHMRYALRPWWSLSKFGHVLLRIFFPESIIWFVGREEWERRWVVGEIERRLEEKGQLGGEWDEGSALQRVMSIQGGRVFFRFRDDQEQERDAVRKEMRNLDDELPAMPVAPESRRSSRQDTPDSRRPSTQGQRQGYSPRHPGLSPYLSSPEAISPQSGPRVNPPYPVSEYNLHLDDSTPPIPPIPSQFPQNFRRPSNQTTIPALASQRPSLHRNRTSETQLTTVLLNNTSSSLRGPGITWSVQPPTHLRRLLATDISLYIDILDRLPPGSPTFLNIINFHLALPPDLPTVLLISQLIWAITALALRSHAHSLEGETSVSLLEMYAVYALISFLIERLFIVGCRRPAWGGSGSGGYVIVEMNKADYTHEIQDLPPKHGSSRKAGPKYFWVPLVLMGLAYPAVLITYAAGIYKKSGKSMSGAPHIPAVMGVVTGVYVLAVLGFLSVQALERQGREPVGNWSRWVPKGKWVLWGLVGVGRVVVGVWGIWQIVEARQVGGWEGWWGWPHISG